MMLNRASQDFKTFFLLEFTKELIKAAAPTEIFELKKIVEEEKPEAKKEIKEKVKEKLDIRKIQPSILKREIQGTPLQIPQRQIIRRPLSNQVLRIPEPRLPPAFQYLRPYPTQTEINLGKLNPLIKDPQVKVIECVGENENIIVQGNMGRKPTGIILNNDEINEILKKFSETAKIPLHEGVIKIVAGRLILSAIISEVLGSKFLIKKMSPVPRMMH